MDTASVQPGIAPVFPPVRAASGVSSRATPLAGLACFAGIVSLALSIRAWDIGAAYVSGDQTIMPYLVRHSYGVEWIFARSYGPVTAVVHRAFGEIVSRLGLPISEMVERLPVLLIGFGQVLMTFPLLRRLRYSRGEAMVGMLCCAVLPTLVTDTRLTWAWGYLSIWLLAGTVALWATLAYFDDRDDRRTWQLLVAACALGAHCLSNTYAFALPATLIVAWAVVWLAHRRAEERPGRSAALRSTVIGLVLPCTAALTVIVLCWGYTGRTGRGQIGYLLLKCRLGTAGLQWDQLAQLPRMWAGQFGYLFGLIAAVSMVFLPRADASDRRRLLVVWAWLGLLPVWLLADWDRIGYSSAYFIEVAYASGLLGTMLICSAYRRLTGHRALRVGVAAIGGLALAHLATGTVDDCLGRGRLAGFTGILNEPPELKEDVGAKAAGWYVREHVPVQATILSLHTNKGMESSVAEFYLGRRVLAGYDHRPQMLPEILEAMGDDADVLIVEARHRALAENLADFECVCTLRNHTRPIRYLYARRVLHLPRIDEEVWICNQRYDRRYRPRHIPIPLPHPPDYLSLLQKYQKIERLLKRKLR